MPELSTLTFIWPRLLWLLALVPLLLGRPDLSDMFVLASRSETFTYDAHLYERTGAYSNLNVTKAGDNSERVDGSYLVHLQQVTGATNANDAMAWLGIVPTPPANASPDDWARYQEQMAAHNAAHDAVMSTLTSDQMTDYWTRYNYFSSNITYTIIGNTINL